MVEINQKIFKNSIEKRANNVAAEQNSICCNLTFYDLQTRNFGWERSVSIELTSHAINRMRERGANVFEAIEYFRKGAVVLSKNRHGYEIYMPFKGIFAGDFDNGVFIIKTFLHPFRLGRSSNLNVGRKQTIRVRSLRLPQFLEHETCQYRKLDLNRSDLLS